MVWLAAGTGTFDMGRSTDGTSGGNNIIDGGTMLVGIITPGTIAATGTLGVIDRFMFLVGPAGVGTNNTITVIHDEGVTGTASGFLWIQYMRVEP